MSGSTSSWINYVIGPAVIVFILTTVTAFSTSYYRNWRRLNKVAIALRREVILNVENAREFVANIPLWIPKFEDKDYVPFLTANSKSSETMNLMKEDILELPNSDVDHLTEFYVYDNEINEIMLKIGSSIFEKMDISRKKEVIYTLEKIMREYIDVGDHTAELLSAFIEKRGKRFLNYHGMKIQREFIRFYKQVRSKTRDLTRLGVY